MVLGFLRVLMGYVEAYMVESVDLHLVVDGACYDVARGERKTRVVLLHEFLAVR